MAKVAFQTEDKPLLDEQLLDEEDGGMDMGATMSTHKTILGQQVINDAEGWQYVAVFNRPKDENEVVADPLTLLTECFTARTMEAWSQECAEFFDKIQEGNMKKVDLFKAIWDRIIMILSGQACGFQLGYQPHMDDERILLQMRLVDEDTIEQIADRTSFSTRITPNAYKAKGLECPRLQPNLGQRLGFNKTPPASVPLYLKYDSARRDEFKRSTAERIQSTEIVVNQMVKEWEKGSQKSAADIRRLMRLEDIRAAAMVIMVNRMQSEERDKDEVDLGKLREMFNEMNVYMEKSDKDLGYKMSLLATEEERFKARKERWSPPNFPNLNDFLDAELYSLLSPLDILRLGRHRIYQFMDMTLLEKYGVVDGFFPVHHKHDINALCESWASIKLRHIFQWPGTQHLFLVHEYFGEEVAFFFDWLSYQTRALIFPAILSMGALVCDMTLENELVRKLRFGFAILMVCWIAYLTASYDQTTAGENLQWGMMGYSERATIRSSYDPALRGGLKETVIRIAHWLLVFVFIVETILAAGLIAKERHAVLSDIHGSRTYFGLECPNEVVAQLGLYAVTINIKVMNLLWCQLSPLIAERENWRTDQQMKNQNVVKTFLVKCVVYYYPFFYLAFVRPVVEGCHGDECMAELKKNLAVFIVVHIVTVITMVGVQLGMTWWNEFSVARKIRAKRAAMGKPVDEAIVYTYVQAQVNRPYWDGDTEDYMEVSIQLGFISMFAVVYPLAAFMAFISNLVEMRILAFRMCRVVRRPVPRGQEGIGAWIHVMRFLTYMSCITSAGLMIFELKPLKELDTTTKLVSFVLSEHALLIATYLVGKAIPHLSVNYQLIAEANDDAEGKILGGDSKQVNAKSGRFRCLMPGKESITPGKALESVDARTASVPSK